MAKRVQRGAPPGKVRIIGGEWRGRRLRVPPGTAVRPTPDRVRETLFNWLRERLVGARCIDLFAGTGALGFEALSRGASEVCFVERDLALVRALEEHAAAFGAAARVVEADAYVLLRRAPETQPFDVIFLDPPYAEPLEPLLTLLPPWTAPGAVIYVERPAGQALEALAGPDRLLKQARAGQVRYGLLSGESAAMTVSRGRG